LHIEFIEFTDSEVMKGDEWNHPNFGGAPGEGMAMRSETFFYDFNPAVFDDKRIVMQGRINPDTEAVGSKYWGSYV